MIAGKSLPVTLPLYSQLSNEANETGSSHIIGMLLGSWNPQKVWIDRTSGIIEPNALIS